MEHIKKILVVDDEMGIRSLLSELLESEGFEVRAAKDGQESLDEMEREDFDLVITDIQMPRLDGLAMLDAMKRAGRKEKIIIMTGSALAMDLPNEEMPMVVSRLQKPFRMSNLLDVVSAANAGVGVIH
jgi:two-component system, response regulator, stage 0 sporulation protein F